MIPELGHFALILALLVSIVQGTFPLVGAHRQRADWVALARPAAQLVFVLAAVSFGCLAWSFMANDYSVLYVAQHSNSKLPDIYRFAAVWGGHEGSLLLWVLMSSIWGLGVATFSRQLPDDMVARVLGVLGLLAVGFLLFILATSNPFTRLVPAAADGRDLNPLLQDPGLVFHPPMLYMGYVGFSVAFAFAISALLSGRLDAAWARWSRPWTTAAWIFLTFGIALGSWWAYYELGWGGWWFWDPVENASFMPWLVGTALIHSLAVTEKRGTFKNWTIILAISAFSLSLLGTFLVRSGVLTSVHAFATDPTRGVFILIFLCIVVGGSLGLFAWRAGAVTTGGHFAVVSREALLLLNNVLLMAAAASVLLGTLYPLIVDALNLGKISVGPPYFNSVFGPLMIPLLMLMPLGPLARWKAADWREVMAKVSPAFVLALVAGIAVPLLMGGWSWLAALGAFLATWIVVSSALHIVHQTRRGTVKAPISFWGMHLAHCGIAVFVVGATLVSSYQTERDVRMAPGDTVSVGSYTFRLVGVSEVQGPNYVAQRGDVELSRDGQVLRSLHPEKRKYFSSSMPMTEAAIDAGLTGDRYVALGEALDGGAAWSLRVYSKPFVDWIWGGCLLMGLGGVLAAADRRYRLGKARAAAAVVQGAPA
ncbi:heme lyase CcmF/NrfE family subunit [Piscinibacter gummiphilus]|uniref:C-type cytochrome biogenesis protein CcmF n=1 Tax=Piscinibacter gummiphilus TaxID=946333 RepID=A0A1W6L871_9BURK|nr:heme lyase CcmF/NrfE family subunit [Piscinibacter gummiphilus]ARN20423.1 c-type cytochrome biogenesis protein CcmF [Piscinibacter gummiphilus]ATU65097.1 heme lyase CcmF/NrfE family subunit [Piscinibacter gummiphilus]GLS98511.1 cytochrome c-type biogenesis protein CcmF [Piscinibacter gummiphilus]